MHSIESVYCEAKKNKWSYPKKFQALKDAGVTSYTVHFINNFDSVYRGSFGIWNEPAPVGYVPSILSDQFSVDGIRAAIKNNMTGQTSYSEFLVGIAAAGVSHYVVDMDKRTVTYLNEDETQFHEECVPVWKE